MKYNLIDINSILSLKRLLYIFPCNKLRFNEEMRKLVHYSTFHDLKWVLFF